MTATELRTLLGALYGEEYRMRAPAELGITTSTLDRWVNGHVPVSETAAILVRLMLRTQRDLTRRRARATKRRARFRALRKDREFRAMKDNLDA